MRRRNVRILRTGDRITGQETLYPHKRAPEQGNLHADGIISVDLDEWLIRNK
ncbi:MAG: hypothetical protein PHE39_01535 [Methanoculleus bourgensis]|jgi:hypothetical protein|nr:hypothetical protein [Methanoculleus bourgensis]